MPTIVDLTMPLSPETQPPGDYPHLTFSLIKSHGRDGFQSGHVTMSIHTGTHVDAPFHFAPEAEPIDAVPLGMVIGPGRVVDLEGAVAGGDTITIEHLKQAGAAEEEGVRGLRLLLHTGWGEAHWNQGGLYSDAPHFDPETARLLRDLGPDALGVDFPVDAGPPFPAHVTLLRARIPLIENLVNMRRLVGREFTFVAAPLKLLGADGGPTRAFALLPDGA